MRRIAILIIAFICLTSQLANCKYKVACIGDSVTYGMKLEDREHESYPAQLGMMLGSEYDVRNFGHNGATLLQRGHRPYTTLEEYTEALGFSPDIAIIHLGLNDTDPRDWPDYSDDFITDYRQLIGSLREVNPKMRIWVCILSPIMPFHPRFLSGTRDWHSQIRSLIARIAETDDVGLIDLYGALIDRPDLFPDNIHPTAEGATIIARTVYSAITGDYGGLKLNPFFSDGMVLQRGKELRMSGSDDAGEKVSVELCPMGKGGNSIASGSSITASDGRWCVTFPELQSGGPYRLTVSDRHKSLSFKNVWVGEVWLCSGQSNMAFTLNGCSTAENDLKEAGRQSRLHLFNMEGNWTTNDTQWPESALDSVDRLQFFSTSGWQECSANSAKDFSAIGYHFGRSLADSLQCHVGIISCAVGGSTTESWVDYEYLETYFPEILKDWYDGDFGQPWARGRAKKNISLSHDKLQRHPYVPGYLFSAGIKKIDRYPIRGVVWYQGESNTHNIEAHEKLFRLLTMSWRHYWKEDLPFEVVQLSGIGTRPSWPKFRDSQRKLAAEDELVHMTVCSDLGNETDVHPKAKKPVGERLTRSALHYEYGRKDVIPSGPVYKGMKKEGSKLILSFEYADGIKASKGFEIAGRDGVYHSAEIKVAGTEIFLSSPLVPDPRAVRYAWQPNPTEADLTNSTGIAASTFKEE